MKYNSTKSILLAGGLLASFALTSQAQITANYQTDGSSSSTFDSFVAPNLIQAGQSSLASVRADTAAISSAFHASGLNDGSAAGPGNETYYAAVGGNGTVMPNTAIFQLTAGYNLTNIQVISGWANQNLGEQVFQVLVSIGGGAFMSIGTFTNNTDVGSGNSGSWMTTLTSGTGTIATNVTGIEFIFLNPDTSNGSGHVGTSQAGNGSAGGTVIHEVQVFGTFYAPLTPAATANYQSSSVSDSAFDSLIAPNLIQSGQASLASAAADSSALSGTFSASGLNDGSAAGPGNETYYEAVPPNGTYMPNTAIFQLTAGYNITNIQVISGWGSGNLGEQAFQVLVSIGGGVFTDIGTFVNNTDVGSGNPGSWLTTLTAGTGAIATNVTAIEFIFLNPDARNGIQTAGPSQAGSGGTVVHEVQVFGTYYTNLPTAINLANIIQNNQTDGSSSSTFDSLIAPNLIQAGQSSLGSATADDSALDANFFTSGLNDGSAAGSVNLTYYSAATGNGTGMPNTAIFQLTAGYNLTNIQVISGWTDHNLGEQAFQVLLSVGGGTFTSIGTFNNNTSFGLGASASWLTTLTASTGAIATNVTGIEFIFLNPDTSMGTGNVGTSQAGAGSTGGTVIHELQVFGTLYSATPVAPTLDTPRVSGGNLILTGTGGTPNSGCTWLTTTNLSAPITWTTNSTGTLDGTGAFSNAIPINTAQPARFFRLRLP